MLEHPKAQGTDKVKLPEMSASEMDNQQERWTINAARLAMLFDTDGFISMRVSQRSKTRMPNMVPMLGAVNTSFPLIEWAAETLKSMGVGCYVQTVDWRKYKWSRSRLPQMRFSVQGMGRVRTLLPIVRPYLIAKSRQAELLDEFITSRWGKDNWYKSEYTDRQLALANEIRSCNSNKGGNFRPISPESIRAARELRDQLKGMMCSDLTRNRESVAETPTPVA